MSLLMRNANVATRYWRRLRAEHRRRSPAVSNGGQPVDWFYYVNGVEASKGAASTNVHPGDHIWWDRHDWSQTDDVPAVVGSFPQPFLNGIDGKRLPVRVECADVGRRRVPHGDQRAARAGRAGGRLGARQRRRRDADAARAVGPWRELAGEVATCANSSAGPRASGVYARFSPAGATLALLDAQRAHGADARRRRRADRGHAQRRRRAGVGRHGHRRRRRRRARRARSTRATLRNRFAVAVDAGGALALPRPGA